MALPYRPKLSVALSTPARAIAAEGPSETLKIEHPQAAVHFWETGSDPVDFAFATRGGLITGPKEMLAQSVKLFKGVFGHLNRGKKIDRLRSQDRFGEAGPPSLG